MNEQELKCPSCNSNEFRCLVVTDFKKGKMYRCTNCGVKYNPEDTFETCIFDECSANIVLRTLKGTPE